MTSIQNDPFRKEIWEVVKGKGKSGPEFFPLDELPGETSSATTVYTTIRTYRRSTGITRYLQFERHLLRLNESLKIEGIATRVDADLLKQAIPILERKNLNQGDLRIKVLIVAAGSMRYILQLEPLTTPRPEAYQLGVPVFTTHYLRANPRAKSFQFVGVQDQIRSEVNKPAEEILMLDENDDILEGLSSNFFGIIDGEIHTAERGVLYGVTRTIVLDIAQRLGLKVNDTSVNLKELGRMAEGFVTSTSRGVLPVSRIDQKVIGSGKPGPITCKLMELFEIEIEKLIKPL